MAVSLYKEGDTHEVRGVVCTIVRCEIKQMEYHLNNGCVKDPKELNKPVNKVINWFRQLYEH